MTKLPATFHLKGIRDVSASFSSRVWLNHKFLKLEKSLKVKTHTLAGFNWGSHEPGACQLALAICLEFYAPEIAQEVYLPFKSEFLTPIGDDSFSLDFDLSAFNETHVRQRMKVLT